MLKFYQKIKMKNHEFQKSLGMILLLTLINGQFCSAQSLNKSHIKDISDFKLTPVGSTTQRLWTESP